ncbi:MAG: hypothetical protein GEU90_04600 [Gemmatimonas sp.]|nr:hypothetical protein [Gemmatimonas sp.]
MRALVLIPITLTAAMLTACSDGEITQVADPDLASELELAIFSGIEESVPVLSELEIHRPEESKPAGPAEPVAIQDTRAMPEPQGPNLLGEAVAELASTEIEPVTASAADGINLEPVATPGAEEDSEARGSDMPRPNTGGIIIRGGVSGRDPCKRHSPGTGGLAGALPTHGHGGGLGTVGAMVNDRAPRPAGNRGTRAPSGRGFGGGGAVFAGGIR